MSNQLSFPEFDQRPASPRPQALSALPPSPPPPNWQQRTDVFFAIYPPDDIGAAIDVRAMHLKAQHALEGRPFGGQRYHATLCPIGVYSDMPSNVLDAVKAIASTVVSPPFDVAFDRVESFRRQQGKRPVVLLGGDGVSGLVAFQRLLEMALRKSGFPRWITRPYNPHVTLLYDKREILQQMIDPVCWTVREFTLVRSLIGLSQHVPLEKWPLRG
jgi:RNA 2',3'-cyclic 3'-phosphodiesterase